MSLPFGIVVVRVRRAVQVRLKLRAHVYGVLALPEISEVSKPYPVRMIGQILVYRERVEAS